MDTPVVPRFPAMRVAPVLVTPALPESTPNVEAFPREICEMYGQFVRLEIWWKGETNGGCGEGESAREDGDGERSLHVDGFERRKFGIFRTE